MRAVWIALGTGGINCGNGTRKQRNAGCDKRREDGADERDRFHAIGFHEVAEANEIQVTRHKASKGTN
jgi:hypothetical protein